MQPGQGTVGTTQIADSSVTAAKLASGAARSNWGAGGVLQVIQATTTTPTTVSSGSISATALTASITPSSTSSKILVFASGLMYNTATGGGILLYRNGSLIFSPSAIDLTNKVYQFYTIPYATPTINYLDSPSSTSSTTYTVYLGCYTGSTTFPHVAANQSGSTASIQLLEIAA
jgi:hypothetical protein